MNAGTEFLKGCTETVVLKLLSEKRMYGYELVSEIKRRSGGFLNLAQGTVYPLLYALERKGFIVGLWEEGTQEGERRRKYYELTAKGKQAVKADISEWDRLVKGMTLLLGGTHASGV